MKIHSNDMNNEYIICKTTMIGLFLSIDIIIWHSFAKTRGKEQCYQPTSKLYLLYFGFSDTFQQLLKQNKKAIVLFTYISELFFSGTKSAKQNQKTSIFAVSYLLFGCFKSK